MEIETQVLEALEEFLRKSLISFDRIDVVSEAAGEGEAIIRMNIATDEPGLIIGKHAENLFALQQLLRLIVRKKYGITQHVIIDVDNYRRNQEASAAILAKEAARRAKESGLPQELIPMPSYKRRAVHTFFTHPDYQGFKVYSVGEGEERRVRVELK